MGREALCQCSWAGSSARVKALIEPPNLILRGEIRRRIPLAALQDIHADGDQLRFTFAGEAVSIELGSALAARWAKAISEPPPTLARKLGITPESSIHLVGKVDDEELQKALGAAKDVSTGRGDLIVARVNTEVELASALQSTARELARGTPLWFVYPKGRGHALNESRVRATALAAGLVDTKVAAVSQLLTALRFVKRRDSGAR